VRTSPPIHARPKASIAGWLLLLDATRYHNQIVKDQPAPAGLLGPPGSIPRGKSKLTNSSRNRKGGRRVFFRDRPRAVSYPAGSCCPWWKPRGSSEQPLRPLAPPAAFRRTDVADRQASLSVLGRPSSGEKKWQNLMPRWHSNAV
jgi:hypothetical protein